MPSMILIFSLMRGLKNIDGLELSSTLKEWRLSKFLSLAKAMTASGMGKTFLKDMCHLFYKSKQNCYVSHINTCLINKSAHITLLV